MPHGAHCQLITYLSHMKEQNSQRFYTHKHRTCSRLYTHNHAQNLLRPKLQASEHGHPPHRTVLHHPHYPPISPHLGTTLHWSCIFCSRCMLWWHYTSLSAVPWEAFATSEQYESLPIVLTNHTSAALAAAGCANIRDSKAERRGMCLQYMLHHTAGSIVLAFVRCVSSWHWCTERSYIVRLIIYNIY